MKFRITKTWKGIRVRHAFLRSVVLTICVALVLAACGGGEKPEDPVGAKRHKGKVAGRQGGNSEPRPQDQIDELINEMSIEERVGQLVMTAIQGTSLSRSDAAQIRRQHLGGVIVFKYNWQARSQMTALTAAIRRAATGGNSKGISPLISTDQEGGFARAIPSFPPGSSAGQYGRGTKPAVVRQVASESARSLKGVGINMNLAPVADLDLPPRHVMRGRSFGVDHRKVAQYVQSSVAGMQDAGVIATVKHFPGFGGSTVNSDFGVSYVDRPMSVLQSQDMVPFAVSGADAVMISHGIYRRAGFKKPATVTSQIVTGELRQRLRYQGVVVTDSMNAKGFRESVGMTVPQACVPAFVAGVDILLLTGSFETSRLCAARLREAVGNGRISESRLNESVRRVLLLKKKRGLLADQRGSSSAEPSPMS